MMKDTALAMNWLHKSKPQVIHRDLKPSNLLIGEDFQIKVGDFGLSEIITEGETLFDSMKEAKGSPLWMPPEVLSLQQFDEKSDIYAFGIILWEALTREEPYQEYNNLEEFTYAICQKRARPSIPPGTPASLARLMQQCWQHDPSKRPSFSVIIQDLDRAIVDAAIQDPVGRRFWIEYFPNQDQVSWPIFSQAFHSLLDYYHDKSYLPLETVPTREHLECATDFQLNEFASRGVEQSRQAMEERERRESSGDVGLSVEDISLFCLREILLEDSQEDDMVTMKKFGKTLAWFGPVVGSTTEPKVILLTTLYDTLSKDWFHGDIDQHEAERRLAHRPQGTFRFSSIVGCFTVSKVDSGVIVHQRIVYQIGQGFSISKYSAETLVKLVNQVAMKIGLYQCCP
eukprot:CAMPEP_0117010202 /NCGR_PEP_ID=MMETSP0472-20121206/9056_1 /TAXON_ID=693140 ORGANISM="Tiarina fusus, Strain LIS" /NCGR_SAMPLE_ID=MMETSP0472 /ASSEMBLY_ACC=CAM_ASM_000603 /LENGTH=398 /DNA_ID=CAMNT_0004712683 /DNA_START=255 /DNA_END=1447 /DNA_ORIENTATION=-